MPETRNHGLVRAPNAQLTVRTSSLVERGRYSPALVGVSDCDIEELQWALSDDYCDSRERALARIAALSPQIRTRRRHVESLLFPVADYLHDYQRANGVPFREQPLCSRFEKLLNEAFVRLIEPSVLPEEAILDVLYCGTVAGRTKAIEWLAKHFDNLMPAASEAFNQYLQDAVATPFAPTEYLMAVYFADGLVRQGESDDILRLFIDEAILRKTSPSIRSKAYEYIQCLRGRVSATAAAYALNTLARFVKDHESAKWANAFFQDMEDEFYRADERWDDYSDDELLAFLDVTRLTTYFDMVHYETTIVNSLCRRGKGAAPERLGNTTNSIGMRLSLIPPGEFQMGSGEVEFFDHEFCKLEGPQHWVRITRPFYLGVYEVTQAQYQAVMGRNPSHFKGATLPVEQVDWDGAVEFCRELGVREGHHYRLPTEAEWEYACRAGRTRPCLEAGVQESDEMWDLANSGGRTHAVGQKRPNAWGLYDMLGNVWEWCSDWYWQEYYSKSPLDDPSGPSVGLFRTLRGGSWQDRLFWCRPERRLGKSPRYFSPAVGFRVVRDLEDTYVGKQR